MNRSKNKSNKENLRNDREKKKRKKKIVLKPSDVIDYHQVDVLVAFMTEQYKIKPRRLTRLTLKQQRQLSQAVKRARLLKLLPYVKTTES